MALIQKNVQLSEINVQKFERYFPANGGLSWALDMLLEKFVAQYDKTPAEYAAIAASEFKDEVET